MKCILLLIGMIFVWVWVLVFHCTTVLSKWLLFFPYSFSCYVDELVDHFVLHARFITVMVIVLFLLIFLVCMIVIRPWTTGCQSSENLKQKSGFELAFILISSRTWVLECSVYYYFQNLGFLSSPYFHFFSLLNTPSHESANWIVNLTIRVFLFSGFPERIYSPRRPQHITYS